MVAYNFTPGFETAIIAGAKTHTVRAPRRAPARHARPGEAVRLWTGMRTTAARLIAEHRCSSVRPCRFQFGERAGDARFDIDGRPVEPEAFARSDGFEDLAAMRTFWFAQHARRSAKTLTFEGFVISWA